MNLFFIIFLFLSPLAYAEQPAAKKSELDLGVGYGTGSVPHYPASSQNQTESLFLPIIVYRGDVLKSDREDGTRVELFKSLELDINLSFGATFNNDSSENEARRNMPNLNYTLETGPALNFKLWSVPNYGFLRLQVPLRLNFETDFKKTDFLGFVFEPELRFQKTHFLIPNLRSSTSIASEFFSERVANYFYEVEPQYATPERPVYNGRDGLSAFKVSQNFMYEYEKFSFIMGTAYSNFSYSANKQSPLFKSVHNQSYFIAVAWLFYKTSTTNP